MKGWTLPLAGIAMGLALFAPPSTPSSHAASGPRLAPHRSLCADKPKKKNGEDKEKLPPYTGLKKRIAVVMNAGETAAPSVMGDGYVPLPVGFGNGLAEMLTTELFKTGRFVVVERQMMEKILNEGVLGQSGLVTDSTAPEIGKLTGAQLLITGKITNNSFEEKGGSFATRILGTGGRKAKSTIALDLRLIDTTTGELVDAIQAEGSESSGGAFRFNSKRFSVGSEDFKSSTLGKASRKAVEKAVTAICERIEKRPWEGVLASVDEEDGKTSALYIDGGSRAGLKVGDELEIVRLGEEIRNPAGVMIGRKPGKTLGRCKVEAVTDLMATAKPLSGDGFKIGDAVRLVEKK